MISFDIGPHRFQFRAAGIFTWDGQVLLHRLEGDDFWALPGGRVEPGEDAAATLVREMREELGEDVVCGPLAVVVENFFDVRDRRYHELGFYFRADLPPGSRLLDGSRSHAGVEGERALEFKWFPLDGLDAVDLRPTSLRAALARPAAGVVHLVQRD